MPSLTIRDIPDYIMNKLRTVSKIEKRSINSEILLLLEQGLREKNNTKSDMIISRKTRMKIWESLSGTWSDARSTEEIIEDIYSARTRGRDHSL